MKRFLKSVPVIGPALVSLKRRLKRFKSADYWEKRYEAGGTSGAGSYNRLAEFKANFLNKFVEDHQISSVIEFGCGDGAQLGRTRYPNYIGVDISHTALEICRSKFCGDGTKRFLHWDAVTPDIFADLSLSLDVVYHLIEDPVFEAYMQRLFDSGRRFVIVYSSNNDQATTSLHVRHRHFTNWVDQNSPQWRLESTVKNAYPFDPSNPDETSFADFYVFEPVNELSAKNVEASLAV